jgi:ketosteroid isomerase-like protein
MAYVQAGDISGARSCLHTDARIWHNYDSITQTVDENMGTLAYLVEKSTKLEYVIHRLEEIKGGYLQQHTLNLTTKSGDVLSTEAIAIIAVKDEKIIRIDEWLDPSPFAPLRDH